MEPSRKLSSSAIVLVLLLVVATEMMGMVVVQARVREKPSSHFKGLCLQSQYCTNKCMLEGYMGGKCKYLTRRCICSMECATTSTVA
uniref:Knottins-like domain-containing protein n=1 Tax=Oryza punctata TaxID=4537 RepID=A0A0E0JX94_ORYPU